jgi:hypothetical protein
MIVTKMTEERQYYIARERLEVLQKSVGISVIKITIQHKIKMAEEFTYVREYSLKFFPIQLYFNDEKVK